MECVILTKAKTSYRRVLAVEKRDESSVIINLPLLKHAVIETRIGSVFSSKAKRVVSKMGKKSAVRQAN